MDGEVIALLGAEPIQSAADAVRAPILAEVEMSIDPTRVARAAGVLRTLPGAEVTYPEPEPHASVVFTITTAAKGACVLRLSCELFDDRDDDEIERFLLTAIGQLSPGDSWILTSHGVLSPYPPRA